uniref:EF-hand domain-containing protein n=1 Tax=Kalanchoe fedtschenkoi TaxID=63787 RepID=A0A7N0U728_KALFE
MAIRNKGMTGGSATTKNGEMTLDQFKKWLKHFDEDKDGRISREELEEAVHYAGSWFGGWRSKRAMRAADGNGSGFIEDHEIEKLVEFARKHTQLTASATQNGSTLAGCARKN